MTMTNDRAWRDVFSATYERIDCAGAAGLRVEGAWTAFPRQIGRVSLGERPSDGDTLCSHSHDVPAGHPLYWPERMGEYPDDMDPLCLTHAIEQAEIDQGWCERCDTRDLDHEGGGAVSEAGARLVGRKVDDECGCPEEIWDTPWGELHMHLSAGKPSNACLDNGDEGERHIDLTTATIAEARAAIMGWAALASAEPVKSAAEAGEPIRGGHVTLVEATRDLLEARTRDERTVGYRSDLWNCLAALLEQSHED